MADEGDRQGCSVDVADGAPADELCVTLAQISIDRILKSVVASHPQRRSWSVKTSA